MTSTLLTLVVLLPAAPAPAPKDTGPKGLPPRIVMVSAGAEGTLEILQTTQKSVPQQVTEQTQVGNRLVPVTKTVMVSVPMQQIIRVSLDDKGVQVYGADGKKIDAKDVPKRVRKPVAALLSADGKPVDPFYLRLAREETLVLVVPPSAAAPKPPAAKPVPERKR